MVFFFNSIVIAHLTGTFLTKLINVLRDVHTEQMSTKGKKKILYLLQEVQKVTASQIPGTTLAWLCSAEHLKKLLIK